MNPRTQNKDSPEDGVSTSPDPSKGTADEKEAGHRGYRILRVEEALWEESSSEIHMLRYRKVTC